jgi:hypothetical protein
VILTALAWYAALALLLENVAGRAVLPTLRRLPAGLDQDTLASDMSDVAVEPGVRHPA